MTPLEIEPTSLERLEEAFREAARRMTNLQLLEALWSLTQPLSGNYAARAVFTVLLERANE